jgi:acyl-CoA thioesterase-2
VKLFWREPLRCAWLKAIDKLPDDPAIHQYLLAYASDFGLIAPSLYPHGHSPWEPDMQVASLDHAMWFHRKFRMDEWLLYVMKSTNACKARGLSDGKIYPRGAPSLRLLPGKA